jgi:AcrR family transcriptional regulator
MPRAGLSRDRVIEAGAELADQHGFDGLTVSALARRLRVTDPTLYSHVRGIADVRAGIAILAAGEMAERLGAAIQGRASARRSSRSRMPTEPMLSSTRGVMPRLRSASIPT